MARSALTLNPSCCSELWNTFGDCLFLLGRMEESRQAFQHALAINPQDVRAHYNLTFVLMHEKDFPAALATIAQGLALDQAGEYREGLLQKQAEVLGHLTSRFKRDYLLMVNRTSKYPASAKKLLEVAQGSGADRREGVPPRQSV